MDNELGSLSVQLLFNEVTRKGLRSAEGNKKLLSVRDDDDDEEGLFLSLDSNADFRVSEA